MEAGLISIRDAARLLGTTPSTLYGRVFARTVPFVKDGRSVRFRAEDLEEYIRRRAHSVDDAFDEIKRRKARASTILL